MTDTSIQEEKTFRKLKQTPFEELDGFLAAAHTKHPPIFQLGTGAFESRKHELVRHYERLKCLEEHGWTLEEFVLEAEKRNIVRAIEQYNQDNTFPMDLVNRAKEFFPNARFIQASIELE
jgi:hypothetical protein